MTMHVKTLKPLGLTLAMAVAVTALPAAQQTASQQGTVFRATTNYVSTDVLVHDKDGKFIPDLTAKDFTVYEDGVPQAITNFVRVVGGRALGGLTAAGTAPAATEGLILPPSRPSTDASGRIFIIFIDDLHIEASQTPQMKQLLQTVRDTLVHDNDLVGIVSTGTSAIEIDPAYDFGHRRFNEAIAKVMGSAATANDIIQDAFMEGASGPTGLRYNAHVAFSTAYDMLSELGKIADRRKSFIYLSNGYSFNPYQDARFKSIQKQYEDLGMTGMGQVDGDEGDPNNQSDGSVADSTNVHPQSTLSPYDALADPDYRRRTEFAESDLDHELAELVAAARRANTAFYAIDPHGLRAGTDISLNQPVAYSDIRDTNMTQISSLRVLSDETGGFCICETNDFKSGLQRIDNETSDYYIIGYSPSNPDPLRFKRTIKIDVDRPDVARLDYRETYLMPRPKKAKK
ncbi:MAG TPA: VWA domain-containing protein [Vicinamibacterales bacterium]|jgi:VWFA-related protein|nr:VWA domain-containing protein [Vicinamibacterales bacterium]